VFILIPWKVDVPQERWPVMNWLIIAALVATFALQVADVLDHVAGQDIRTPGTQQNLPTSPQESPNESDRRNQPQIPGITGRLLLQDWSLKGLFGYMWLHGDPLHLAGNVLFLWIFGNAVCAKLGNLLYLILYVFCGVLAGVVHLLFVSGPVLGASGAINGVVGMYLVLFYENEITCVFGWLIPPLLKCFDVSSIWMIFFWLFWDIVGGFARRLRRGLFRPSRRIRRRVWRDAAPVRQRLDHDGAIREVALPGVAAASGRIPARRLQCGPRPARADEQDRASIGALAPPSGGAQDDPSARNRTAQSGPEPAG
jgi:membrane associated rhomboid family serine protease